MIYYEYGGMKHTQKTKSHIIRDDGIVLCGVKSNWMEAGEEIFEDGHIDEQFHFPKIQDEPTTCKKCLKKWINEKGDKG